MYINPNYSRFTHRDDYSFLMKELRDNLWEFHSRLDTFSFTNVSAVQTIKNDLKAEYASRQQFNQASDIDCLHDMYQLFIATQEDWYPSDWRNNVSMNSSLLCDFMNMQNTHTDFVRHEIENYISENPPSMDNLYVVKENRLQHMKEYSQLFVTEFPSKDMALYQYTSDLLRIQKEQTGKSANRPSLNKKMSMFRMALSTGHDVTPLTEHYNEFNMSQFREVLNGILQNVDVSLYNNPELSAKQMKEMREDMEQGKDMSVYQDADKLRLFVDMDGTLAKWEDVPYFERLLEKGYFLERPPLQNVIDAVRTIHEQHPDVEIYILSSCLKESEYAEAEKNAWLDQYLPEIDADHRLFPAFGEDKTTAIHGGIRKNDFLLDDYSQNLFLFDPPATGIKILNGINHTRESWKKNALSFEKSGQELADDIFAIMDYKIQIRDRKPQGITIDNSAEVFSDELHNGTSNKNVKYPNSENLNEPFNINDIVLDKSGAICRISKITTLPENDNESMVCTAPLPDAEQQARKLGVEYKEAKGGYGWYRAADITLLASQSQDPGKRKNPIKEATQVMNESQPVIGIEVGE